MSVSDATITTTTAASFIPTIWSVEVLEAAEFAAMIQKRVYRDWESEMAIGGTFEIPRLSNLSTQAKSSGVSNTIVFEAVTEGNQQVAISTHEYAAFLIENVAAVQANQDLRARYVKKIGYALARGRDVTLANLFQNLTTVVGTYGVELASDDYLTAYQKLAEAGLLEDSVDPGEDFSIFLSPASYVAAMKVDVFTNKLYNSAADAIQKAQIGDIYGFPVFLSNLLRVPSAGQHDNAAFYRMSFGMIVQKEVQMASQYIIRNLADGVVGWNLYGSARVLFPPETPGGGSAVDNRGVLLKSV